MNFITTSSEIKNDEGVHSFFERLKGITGNREGYCYYKYPIAGGLNTDLPDIIIADFEFGICLFNFFSNLKLNDINSIDEYEWVINEVKKDSPILQLEDYVTNLQVKYDKHRPLRGKVVVNYYATFPLIKRDEFAKKFNAYDIISNCKFLDDLVKPYNTFWEKKSSFYENPIKNLFKSVTQGAGRLNETKRIIENMQSALIGEAIKLIDTKIAYLDNQQHAAAIQIPDGPQRIRGMAGTGKTIILTMKAAFLHSRYPEKKILYTFHTQSLYSQIRDLITKFYRDIEEKDANWNNIQVMHSWGGKGKEGVYSRACMRNSISPMAFVRNSPTSTLDYVCQDALKHKIDSEYDFVLMDEAQDFPPSFYQLIYELTFDPKRIIFAYDELQSLNRLRISDTGDLFGYKDDGTKRVDFSKGTYDEGIEMDFVLYKSYRNPLPVLMAAHSIGLGLYNDAGFMQIIDSKEVWNAIGYEVLQGDFKEPDEEIIIKRPTENSRSIALELYSGKRKSLNVQNFKSRIQEIEWIAQQIINDVKNEKVEPEDILVISINQTLIDSCFIPLQKILKDNGIPSIIPGVGGIDRDRFKEKGFVTLSTVYKAKGNEAFIVYVMAFDFVYFSNDFVTARNRAFTSISRSKGWCHISGIGKNMEKAKKEIENTVDKLPFFKFKFPDPEKIERILSQEQNAQKLLRQSQNSKAIKEVLKLDLSELSDEDILMLSKKFGDNGNN